MKVSSTSVIFIIIVGYFLFMAWPALKQFSGQGLSLEAPFPVLLLEDKSGLNFELKSGKVRVLNVWASWCAPCREELPMLEGLAERWRAKDVEVLLFNEEIGAKPRVEDFLRARGITLDNFFLNAPESRKLGGIAVVPTTFVVDKNGRLAARYNRLVSDSELEKVLRNLTD